MCGIIGGVGRSANSFVNLKYTLLQHRGPDNFGLYTGDLAAFAHVRLSILDLSENSNQPLVSSDKIICFNGEIYNFKRRGFIPV